MAGTASWLQQTKKFIQAVAAVNSAEQPAAPELIKQNVVTALAVFLRHCKNEQASCKSINVTGDATNWQVKLSAFSSASCSFLCVKELIHLDQAGLIHEL